MATKIQNYRNGQNAGRTEFPEGATIQAFVVGDHVTLFFTDEAQATGVSMDMPMATANAIIREIQKAKKRA